MHLSHNLTPRRLAAANDSPASQLSPCLEANSERFLAKSSHGYTLTASSAPDVSNAA